MCPRCNGMGGYSAWVGSQLVQRRCEMCDGTGGPGMRQDRHGGCLGPLFWGVAGVVVVCFLLGRFVLPRLDTAPGSGSGEVPVSRLAVGDCYLLGSERFQIRPTPCAAQHDGEVLARTPTDTSVQYPDELVDEVCRTLFSRAVVDLLDVGDLSTNNMWSVAQDELVCTAVRPAHAEPLVGNLP